MSSSIPNSGARSPKNPNNTYNALQDDLEAGANSNKPVEDHSEFDEKVPEADNPIARVKPSVTWKNYDKVIEEREVDIEVGGDTAEPNLEDYPYFDHALVLAVVDRGCWVKTITGTAGNKPSEDVFPWFANSPEIYIRLLWDLLPSDWRIVSFPRIPRNAYDPDEYLKASQIQIKDISEVMLEVQPSTSFRIYLNETKQVVKFTPLPADRTHAAAWVDAIYSAMQLQADEEALQEETDKNKEDDEENEGIKDLLDLRDKYYEVFPDQRPPELEELGEDENRVVVYDPNQASSGGSGGVALGVDEDHSRNSNRNSNKRSSRRLSFTSIYEHQKTEKIVIDTSHDRNCCIIS